MSAPLVVIFATFETGWDDYVGLLAPPSFPEGRVGFLLTTRS